MTVPPRGRAWCMLSATIRLSSLVALLAGSILFVRCAGQLRPDQMLPNTRWLCNQVVDGQPVQHIEEFGEGGRYVEYFMAQGRWTDDPSDSATYAVQDNRIVFEFRDQNYGDSTIQSEILQLTDEQLVTRDLGDPPEQITCQRFTGNLN